MIAIIRVPYLSAYNLLDVREEPIVSSLAGFFQRNEVEYRVFDFHLDRTISVGTLASAGAETYVIAIRGTGLHWKYGRRILLHLLRETDAAIVVYGQTGKLRHWRNPVPGRVSVVPHDELALAQELGLGLSAPSFAQGLHHEPYALDLIPQMGPRSRLFKATIETTRGCHYGCKFCFINHGTNYPDRFRRRPLEDVLADMKAYIGRGIHDFWFYDSEFIGADRSHYPEVLDLLRAIKEELPPVTIMLYCRADTLERLDAYAELAAAGVNSVLLGVESLADLDLKAMRKGQSKETAMNAITALREHEIFCNLSFILFNKSATPDSLQTNLDAMAELYSQEDFIFLGQTLYFSYAFESDWAPVDSGRQLSGESRLSGSVTSTQAQGKGVTFDPILEPFAEICRIINYEQVRKLAQLTVEKASQNLESEVLHRWAALLTLLTLNMMKTALSEFRSGGLRLDTVEHYSGWVFATYRKFNAAMLPKEWRETLTDKVDAYPDGDWNGWESQIPTI